MLKLGLLDKPVDEVGVEVPLADVKVGDIVLFTLGGPFKPERVIDTDVVLKVDDVGVHFDKTYLAYCDKAVDAKVYIAKVLWGDTIIVGDEMIHVPTGDVIAVRDRPEDGVRIVVDGVAYDGVTS